MQLSLEELKTEEMIERIRSDTLEAGIAAIPLESPGVIEMSIGFEAMFAYLPPGDPLLKKAKIQQAELARRELFVMPEGHCFRTQVLSYCKASAEQRKSRVHFESGNFETLIELIDRGLGATVLPALVARGLDDERKEAQLRAFSGPTPLREIGLITGRLDLRRNVTEALTVLLREELSEPLGAAPRRAIVLDPALQSALQLRRRSQPREDRRKRSSAGPPTTRSSLAGRPLEQHHHRQPRAVAIFARARPRVRIGAKWEPRGAASSRVVRARVAR